MKLYYFSEMPHHEYPDEEGAHYPSLPTTSAISPSTSWPTAWASTGS